MRPILSAALPAALVLAGCWAGPAKVRDAAEAVDRAAPIPDPARVAPGLVALPCAEDGALRPVLRGYCVGQRHYVTRRAKAALEDAAEAMARRFPGAQVQFMEASWPEGRRPMPPHLSHGDGRQIDITLFYVDLKGRPLPRPPTLNGYGANEPPRREVERACRGGRTTKNDRSDPPRDRRWRLDEARTRELVRLLADDPRVRRVFIEPHLKTRLGFSRHPKVRFAGCAAARHDDHLHVDFR